MLIDGQKQGAPMPLFPAGSWEKTRKALGRSAQQFNAFYETQLRVGRRPGRPTGGCRAFPEKLPQKLPQKGAAVEHTEPRSPHRPTVMRLIRAIYEQYKQHGRWGSVWHRFPPTRVAIGREGAEPSSAGPKSAPPPPRHPTPRDCQICPLR
jgi:hypothetical protein